MFVTQNIRTQILQNYENFEGMLLVISYYKKASRVSISRPIYRLIVDALLQLFIKKDLIHKKNQGGYKIETAVSLQQFCLQIQLDSDNLLGPLLNDII